MTLKEKLAYWREHGGLQVQPRGAQKPVSIADRSSDTKLTQVLDEHGQHAGQHAFHGDGRVDATVGPATTSVNPEFASRVRESLHG